MNSMFHSISVKEFKYKDFVASFLYKEKETGYLNIKSDMFQMQSSLYSSSKYINLHINNLHSLSKEISLHGDIYVDKKSMRIYANTVLKVQNEININLYASMKNTHIVYILKNNHKIKSIHYLVDSFHLPKPVRYWLLDAIKMDFLNIEKATGFVDLNKPHEILTNIDIDATIHKLNYLYNPKLDSIHTETTQLQFKKGVLYIRPHKAYSYGIALDKSWLKIDFTKKEELLTLHLLFDDGILNKDVLHILNTYQIKLPFLQHTGKVKTKLQITVGLRNIDIQAKGSFYTHNANFDYLGLNIDVQKALIKLDNYDVSIQNMLASYKDIANATVNVAYNAQKSQGTIALNLSRVSLSNQKIKLFAKPLHVVYNISPKGDTIDVNKSTWTLGDKHLIVDPITLPFDLDKLIINVPTTNFNSPTFANGFIGGNFNLKKQTALFNLDLLSLKYKNIILKDSNTQFKIHYDKKLTLSSENDIHFDADGVNLTLSKLLMDITPSNLELKKVKINVNNMLFTELHSSYNLKKNTNLVHLNYLNIVDANTSLYKKKNIDLHMNTSPSLTTISCKELNTQFTMKKASWKFKTKSLSKFVADSPLLQQLKIEKGKLIVEKKSQDKTINLKAKLDYKYPFLIMNNKNIKTYNIKASIVKNQIDVNINDKIKVHIDDNIKINAKNCAIDLRELLKIKKNVQLPQSKSQAKSIVLNTKNVTLQLTKTRKILSDTISMQSDKDITSIQLKYNKGLASFRIKNNIFHLYGTEFNDKFMENLFSLSKFKGGEFEFSLKGTFENYNGAFYIHNTTVIKYKLLNNILAFINTVPSLLTFSLPDYNKNGLDVQTAYAKFHSVHGVFKISDFLVDAKEIDIVGKGEADFNKNSINFILNLKTDLGSDARKIPLVGYIFFDKDVVSTSMKITGKLSDPDIHSLLARDIAVAPLNILKRTILLPFHLLSNILPAKKDKKK